VTAKVIFFSSGGLVMVFLLSGLIVRRLQQPSLLKATWGYTWPGLIASMAIAANGFVSSPVFILIGAAFWLMSAFRLGTYLKANVKIKKGRQESPTDLESMPPPSDTE
jgi:hypothetical protein